MTDLIAAYTKLGSLYPGYVNATREDDGSVVLTVRADPKVVKDSYFLCGFASDKGKPGRCTPGDDRCNNYCNMAPQKGPMQDHPAPSEQVICGENVTVTFSAAEWAGLSASFGG